MNNSRSMDMKLSEFMEVYYDDKQNELKERTMKNKRYVKEFLAEYKASKAEYADYQSAVARWEQQTGNKAEPDSLKAKLQRKTQEVRGRENNRQSHHYRSDRSGR